MTTQTIEMALPPLGQGVDECILIATLAPVGTQVKRGDVVAEVETAKSTVEIVAERDGIIVDWIAEKGTILIVGEAFYRLEIN